MPLRHLSIAAIAALALAAAGCGDDGGDDTGGGLSKQDYIEKADQICQNVNDSLGALDTPQTAQQLADYVRKALPQIDAGVCCLMDLEPGD